MPIQKTLLKSIVLFCVLLYAANTAHSQSVSSCVQLADSLYTSKNYKETIYYYKKLYRKTRLKGFYAYNLHLAYYKMRDTNQDITYFKKAIAYSPEYYYRIFQDTAIKVPAKDTTSINEAYHASLIKHHWRMPWDTVLINKIKQLSYYDQLYRKEITKIEHDGSLLPAYKNQFDSLMSLQRITDTIVSRRFDSLIADYGWIDMSKTGYGFVHNAWAIAQHCTDIKKRKTYLRMMQHSAKEHNYPYRYIAQFIDRTCLLTQHSQLFYTNATLYFSNTSNKPHFSKKQLQRINNRRVRYGWELIHNW